MDWLTGRLPRSFRKTGWVAAALGLVCIILVLACMKCARIGQGGIAYAMPLSTIQYDAQAAPLWQDATLTPTATITPTVTATHTITPTLTITHTATLSPTPTATRTATASLAFTLTPSPSYVSLTTATATTTPDLLGTLLAIPTGLLTSTISAPVSPITATATLIPFPKMTAGVLWATSTDSLNYLAAPVGGGYLPKGNLSIWGKLGRWWPVGAILILWLGLAIWFLVVRALDRD